MNWRDFVLLASRRTRQEPVRSRMRDAMIIYERDVLHDVTWKP